jgi:hypothetical protein
MYMVCFEMLWKFLVNKFPEHFFWKFFAIKKAHTICGLDKRKNKSDARDRSGGKV